MLLEWNVLGRPAGRIGEFSGHLAVLPPCEKLLGGTDLLAMDLSKDDICEISRALIDHLRRRGVAYEWIPFLLKGMSGHQQVKAAMVEFVADAWRSDESIAEQTILIHFTLPLNETEERLLREVAIDCKLDRLKITITQRLEMWRQMKG